MLPIKQNDPKALFKTPFTPTYWKTAAYELKSIRMLVVAAILIAMRVALKSIYIPVGESLNITIGFFVNALGAMIFGPVVAVLGAAVSDTIGALLTSASQGPYFFPFIFVEILGSLLFALFLYRTKLTPARVILSRFAVTLGCNLILNPLILSLYYQMVLDKNYTIFSIPRVIKNLVLFPAESLLLVIFLSAMLPVLKALKLIPAEQAKGMNISNKHVVLVAVLLVIAIVVVIVYYRFYLVK
ncbi:MAG: folate family ECF transporter S component [Clostridia bacterium]|nr:folate family ECF transporter S component [Clostridia bacterium]